MFFQNVNLNEMVMCLEDLINYFAQPEDDMEHEEKQNKFRALRNRQDLFQEEGILNLILEAIDKINVITSQGFLVALSGDESGQAWDQISGYLYQLLAAIIKGNHTNCAQFANSNRLNWLFSRLGSQASSEGTGMLDVLHCVLIDSPEALNMMRVSDHFYQLKQHKARHLAAYIYVSNKFNCIREPLSILFNFSHFIYFI